MSANAGTVKATLEGDSSSFTKSVSSAAESVEQFAKRAKKMATDFAVVGAGITASVIGIVSKVQGISPAAHAGFAAFTNASQTLGIQIATIALPALKSLGDMLRTIANYLAGLSPATRQHIADWIVLAAQVGAAAVVFGRMMELLKGVAMAFQAVSVVFGAVLSIGLGPLLLIVAAIAAIVGTVVLLRKAWVENWGGIQETMHNVITTISGWWSKFVEFLSGIWQGMVDDLAGKVKIMIALFFQLQAAMPGPKNQFAGMQQGVMMQAVDTTAGLAKHPVDTGTVLLAAAGKKISAATGDIVNDFKALMKKLLAELGLDSKPGARAASPMDPELKQLLMAGQAEQRANTLADSQRSISMAKRERDFNNIGRSSLSVTNQKTDGFKDFDDALKQEAAAMRTQEQLVSAAKMMDVRASQLAASGDIAGANAALDSATNLKLLAQQAGVTADSAEQAAQAFEEIKQAPSQFAGALAIGGEIMTKNLGELGAVINDVAKGWQQGGIWGALLALIMDLLGMVDGWKQIQAIANGQLKQALSALSSGLGAVINGLKPLMGAFGMIQNSVMGVLNPILKLIGSILEGLAPIFASIGITLQLMTPIIEVICRILGAILVPIFQILGPILTVVAESFLATELAIQYVILGFDMLVDWVDKLTGGNNQGAIDSDNASIKATEQQMSDLWNKGLGGLADASANAAEQLGKTADAAQSVTNSLQNVPEGFRVAFAEYAATMPVQNNPNVTSTNGGATAAAARNQFLQTGNPVQPGAYPKTSRP